jgi:hypothetical protein
MLKTAVRRIGHSLGITVPKTAIDNYTLNEGDELHLVETNEGVVLTPFNPEFSRVRSDPVLPTCGSCIMHRPLRIDLVVRPSVQFRMPDRQFTIVNRRWGQTRVRPGSDQGQIRVRPRSTHLWIIHHASTIQNRPGR